MDNKTADAILHDYIVDSKKFNKLAESSLEKFDKISSAARNKLKTYSRNGVENNVFASPSDASRGITFLNNVLSTIQTESKILEKEPAIARVVIKYIEKEEINIFYICRCAPPRGVKDVCSYRAPMGRLAALQVGEVYDLGEETGIQKHDETDIFMVQSVKFKPEQQGELWDSSKTEYCDAKATKIITINSLLKLLESHVEADENILAQILAEESIKDNIFNGIRREVIEALSLRDQPILDQYQDEIFRLPLQSSLLLLGPAGSGKTTTLIRRLGQKLDTEYGLDDAERRLIDNFSDVNKPHETSWLMFTPTELLKSYLQEAFNREGILAPDRNISTWDIYKHQLGKDTFKILYTSNFDAGFQLDPECKTLIDGDINSINIYSDFYTWIISESFNDIINSLRNFKSIKKLKNNPSLIEIYDVANKYLIKGEQISSFFIDILKHKNDISSLFNSTMKEINHLIDQELNSKLNKEPRLLHEFSAFIKSLSQNEDEERDEQDDTMMDVFGEEEGLSTESVLKKARAEYRRILINFSHDISSGSPKNRSARNLALMKWLGGRKPSEQVLSILHGLASEAKILSSLNNPINKFFNSINAKYKKFRKLRQSEKIWYNTNSVLRKKIDSTELDILILTNLAASYELLRSSSIYRDTSDSWLSALTRAKNLYVNQIFVDEAPDFSPLQLSCMKLLAHPQVNSFFACGDFNQRITSCGTKSIDDLKNVIPVWKNVTRRDIDIQYRQLAKLYEFSLELLKMIDNNNYIERKPLQSTSIEGFSPVLGKNLKDASLSTWLAERIIEIEKLCGSIPSIAILVPEEADVEPVAQSLQTALNQKTSVIVEPCYYGKARGNEMAIRVFDIKHIKGLEFEAAFFVALDRLEYSYQDLLGNYLYVGTTRAAAFLGMSYEQYLPKTLNTLKHCFVDAWSIN